MCHKDDEDERKKRDKRRDDRNKDCMRRWRDIPGCRDWVDDVTDNGPSVGPQPAYKPPDEDSKEGGGN